MTDDGPTESPASGALADVRRVPEAGDPRLRAARALHPSGGAEPHLDTEVLGVIAAGLGSTVETGDSAPYFLGRTRLLSTEAYDAWLLEWGPDAAAEAHDHAGSASVVHVVRGVLVESRRGLLDSSSDSSTLPEGSTAALDPAGRHQLSNPGPGSTVSVHVYSPPLFPPPLFPPPLPPSTRR